MKIEIQSAAALGPVVRAVRKAQGIRQDDAAGSIGVSENFLGKIERGGETVQWGKLFDVLHGLGIRVTLDVPDETAPRLPPAVGGERDDRRGQIDGLVGAVLDPHGHLDRGAVDLAGCLRGDRDGGDARE